MLTTTQNGDADLWFGDRQPTERKESQKIHIDDIKRRPVVSKTVSFSKSNYKHLKLEFKNLTISAHYIITFQFHTITS